MMHFRMHLTMQDESIDAKAKHKQSELIFFWKEGLPKQFGRPLTIQ